MKHLSSTCWNLGKSESPFSFVLLRFSLDNLRRTQEKILDTLTWLILPVVIRLSQRLSHACLSVNILLWNCKWLIISVIVYLIVPYYLDTRSNSRANTCINTWLFGKVVFIRLKPTLFGGTMVIHDNRADRMAFCRRWIIQVSALSALDGRVLAYHGFNG